MTEPKRIWARVLFLLSVCLMIAFVVLADYITTRQVGCNLTSDRCLAAAVQVLDAPLLWVMPAAAGVGAAAGVILLVAANREPPPRAPGTTWEQWQEDSATD